MRPDVPALSPGRGLRSAEALDRVGNDLVDDLEQSSVLSLSILSLSSAC